jgi:hypothetical protein
VALFLPTYSVSYLCVVDTPIYIKTWGTFLEMAYVCHAKYVFDVNSQTDTVEIDYVKFVPGIGWTKHKDFIDTYPEGDWSELHFDEDSSVKYADFLNTMVHKNIDVARKIAKVSLDNVSTRDPKKLIRIMRAVEILDNTFISPDININCSWQRELLEHIAFTTSYRIIATCTNMKRLNKYFRVFQLI